LWSDPVEGNGESPNWGRGVGVEFGADVSASVCKAVGVERIIRSHQPQLSPQEPRVMHGGRVVTVNATSVYGGSPFVYFLDPKAPRRIISAQSRRDTYMALQHMFLDNKMS
jgi:hypothetical protein